MQVSRFLLMARRTGDETRALLLRVGMQMLLERGVSAGVQHIRLQEVLRRAGLTTGAAYRLWADQNDYQRDLAVSMVRLRLSTPTEYAQAAIDQLIADGASRDEILRAAAASHVESISVHTSDRERVRDTQQFLVTLALRATAETWPELREASHARHQESIDAFSAFTLSLMDAYGMRMKAPLAIEDFTAAMAALSDGFALRAIEGIAHPTIDAGASDEIGEGRWTLFALGLRALVNEFMTPMEDRGSPGVE